MNLKKIFLSIFTLLFVFLSLFLLNQFIFEKIQPKAYEILLFAGAFGLHSVLGLSLISLKTEDWLILFKKVLFWVNIVGFLNAILLILGLFDFFEFAIKIYVISLAVTIAFVHGLILEKITPDKDKTLDLILKITITCSLLLVLTLTVGVYNEFEDENTVIPLIGVFSILVVLGTVLIIVLKELRKSES